MNSIQTTAAVCEIYLKSGSTCGIQAIGRCSTCGRAFCLTHQARNSYGGYVDWCLPCQEAKQAAERKKQEEQNAVVEYFKSGAARTVLLASGVQPVEISWVTRKEVKGFFGGLRFVDEVISVGHGWLLGELKWENRRRREEDSKTSYGADSYSVTYENCLTVLMDLSNDSPNPWSPPSSPMQWYSRPLVPVHPYLGGYATFYYWAADWDFDFKDGWVAAAQAVRRLTGVPS